MLASIICFILISAINLNPTCTLYNFLALPSSDKSNASTFLFSRTSFLLVIINCSGFALLLNFIFRHWERDVRHWLAQEFSVVKWMADSFYGTDFCIVLRY